MQQSSTDPQRPATDALAQAQRSALEMASQLGTLTLNYAMELNRTWFELAQNQLKHFASFPQRLAQCRTPDEVVSVQADLISQATSEYKQGLSAHASMIEKAARNYKEGLDRLASFGETIGAEAGNAMREGQRFVQETSKRAARAAEEERQASQSGPSARSSPEGVREEQAQRAH